MSAKPATRQENALRCPACRGMLKTRRVGAIDVDVCDGGCGGVWFDRFELREVDERHEHAGVALLDIRRDPAAHVDMDAKRRCPRCDDHVPLMRHFFSVKRTVEVDTCPGCAGVWLDAHELGAIRDQFENEAARKAAADAYFHDQFASGLAAMHA
ncbi:MAG: zf-TFIIB domain-containing protein [Myxococcales bacterium]|nr:zf-TFIIB domain-containing protein [Myxococcales bacterium]